MDAAPVWSGQGSGAARILGSDQVVLPGGPEIVALADRSTPWPTASRRELGHRWLGYDLDSGQRPSFRYVVAGVEITDTPTELVDSADPQRPRLRRTLRFAPAHGRTLWFRAARAAQIDDLGGGRVRVGAALRLDLGGAAYDVRAAGDERELLVPVRLRAEGAEVIVDYTWCGGGR